MAEKGTFYGIGVGPGDPELITVKAARLIERERYVVLPQVAGKGTVPQKILEMYPSERREVIEAGFTMSPNKEDRDEYWNKMARIIAKILKRGENVLFLTIGDPLLYSTYIYLIKALQSFEENFEIQTIPGISSVTIASSQSNCPLAIDHEKIMIYPASKGLDELKELLDKFETVVIMKIGKKLPELISLLDERNLTENAWFAKRATLEGEQIIKGLKNLDLEDQTLGNLSTIIVRREDI